MPKKSHPPFRELRLISKQVDNFVFLVSFNLYSYLKLVQDNDFLEDFVEMRSLFFHFAAFIPDQLHADSAVLTLGDI